MIIVTVLLSTSNSSSLVEYDPTDPSNTNISSSRLPNSDNLGIREPILLGGNNSIKLILIRLLLSSGRLIGRLIDMKPYNPRNPPTPNRRREGKFISSLDSTRRCRVSILDSDGLRDYKREVGYDISIALELPRDP